MLWVILTLASSVADTARLTLAKKLTGVGKNEYLVGFAMMLFYAVWAVWLFPAVSLSTLTLTTFAILITSAFLFVLAQVSFIKAVKLSPLSLTIPLLAFGPVLTVIVSFFINKEFPSAIALLGIVIIFVGIYILNLGRLTSLNAIIKPLAAVFEERGARLMLLVVFFYSLTASLDKYIVGITGPYTLTFVHALAGVFW